MRVTVAICTFNPNPDVLKRVLDAIEPQLGDIEAAELLLVDNNSSPALRDQAYLDAYPVRIVEQPVPGLTAAREAAFAAAQGELLVFVDDDNILHRSYLATAVALFHANPAVGVAGGRVIPDYEVEPPRWFAGELEEWLAVKRYDPALHVELTEPTWSPYFPVGAGMVVERALALEYQEDCERTSRIEGRRGASLSSGEDIDMCLFALSRGRTLVVSGQLLVTHLIGRGRLSPDYLERLAVSNIRSSLELENKWAGRLGAPVFPMFRLSLPKLIVRAAAVAPLAAFSPPYRLKLRSFLTLARARLGWSF